MQNSLAMNDPIEDRARLIFNLRTQGIKDVNVLNAIEKVNRADFIDGIFKSRAWEDVPLTIPCGQTISAPSVVARMTEALELDEKSKVLEIGTGSGYQSAILSQLVRRVYTIERHKDLAQQAEKRLLSNNINNVTVFYGDGSLGLPSQAPFDRILLTCAAEDPPSTLLAQLRTNGIMVLPVGQSHNFQTLIRVRKKPEGFEYEELCDVRFVPLLAGRA